MCVCVLGRFFISTVLETSLQPLVVLVLLSYFCFSHPVITFFIDVFKGETTFDVWVSRVFKFVIDRPICVCV